MNSPARRVGIDPIEGVCTAENHDDAYRHWRDAAVAERTLLHIDAHHDMWWIANPARITIANFIAPAVAENLVEQIFWVVPDATWRESRGRRAVLRHVRRLTAEYPAPRGTMQVTNDRIHTVVLGKPLTVCPLALLPCLDQPVLLDIDVDFLVIPRVSYGAADQPPRAVLPWCWPGQLLAQLRDKRVRTDIVTIALSVEGGYTPLGWKYLGEELVIRLADPAGHGRSAQGMDAMREGAHAIHRGDLPEAREKYQLAADCLPLSAAPSFQLAQIEVVSGQVEEGRRLYRHALDLDPAYRTPYHGAGFLHYWEGRAAAAEPEFLRVLALDPGDPYAHLGLALLATKAGRWNDAANLLRAALALDDRMVSAHRALGAVLTHQGRRREAIAAYERSLRLSLSGYKSLERPILTDPNVPRFLDPDHAVIHSRLADLYTSVGEHARAIQGYQISIAGGQNGFAVRYRLAAAYLRQANWRGFLEQLWEVSKLGPRFLIRAGSRSGQALRDVLDQLSRARWTRMRSGYA